MTSSLGQSIIKLICFFDVWDYPLTLFDIWRLLDQPASLFDVSESLHNELVEVVSSQYGFYFLAERSGLVDIRRRRYVLANKKFKKARRISSLLSLFPWLKAVAVYSSLSFFNSKRESDIDLFVVSAPGRLWSCRFFLNFFLKIFHLRPNRKTSQDKICVSLLAAEDNVDLSAINQSEDMLYIYGDAQFIFVYDYDQLRKKFIESNNWIFQYLPNWFPVAPSLHHSVFSGLAWPKKILEKVFCFLPEGFYKKIQLSIMPMRFKKLNNLDGRVIISDKLIKLHDNDKRDYFRIAFEHNLNKVFNPHVQN